ncbi:imidazoleglycerol-phosphate dehydratase HisB [Methanotorris formicicus]|uniref:Imidazoleglycerol-phosphate dehydratase n=1 Tax=Methanotorris formicicus Mc-S-70 TaxID=647171 RepID=H1KY98_9EURY|nr:imidazoleglycerol-phosphate dehydratase HisB [Methanotorris formicicus]EHP87363.1 Imidazoleglycerol-phosphate dehydratase [Methanotorris formicicus Mc-S-70]
MRVVEIKRETKETKIELKINIDGIGKYDIDTGIPFFDHVLSSFAKHGAFDLYIKAEGDLEVDDHHTVEDVGICLGMALDKVEKKNINRFGWAIVPMDEARAMVAIDLGGRPYVLSQYTPRRDKVGDLSTENVKHFFEALANNAKMNIHFEVIGENEHHKIEALFKAFGVALDMATRIDERKGVVSTKGVI